MMLTMFERDTRFTDERIRDLRRIGEERQRMRGITEVRRSTDGHHAPRLTAEPLVALLALGGGMLAM